MNWNVAPAGGTKRTFDQAGYNSALQGWQRSGTGGSFNDEGVWSPGSPAGAAPDPQSFYRDEPSGEETWSGTVSLSPQMQEALNSQQNVQNQRSQLAEGFLGRVGQSYAKPFDESKLYGAPVNPGETYTNAAMRLMQPNMDRQREQLRTQLMNQGIGMGTDAYTSSFRDLGDQQDRMALQAQMAGMDKDFGARQQSIAEQAQLRGMSLNELNALLTGQQVNMPQFPSFASAQSGQAPNLMGAMQGQYGADLNAYNAQAGASGNLMSGLFGLAGSALGPFGAAIGNRIGRG
jgi:hypothetical protein